jgi:hypothetical protein
MPQQHYVVFGTRLCGRVRWRSGAARLVEHYLMHLPIACGPVVIAPMHASYMTYLRIWIEHAGFALPSKEPGQQQRDKAIEPVAAIEVAAPKYELHTHFPGGSRHSIE